MVSLLGAWAYLITGIYYDYGDPVDWSLKTPQWLEYGWIPFLFLTPVITYFCAALYLELQEQIFPARSFIHRTVIAALTLGMALLLYGVFFFSSHQSLASLEAPVAAYQREQAKILETHKASLFKALQKRYPGLTTEEIQEMVDNTPVHMDPGDVPARFPLLPVLIVLYLLGGAAALIKKSDRRPGSIPLFRFDDVFPFCLAAAAVVLILASRGGIIYPF